MHRLACPMWVSLSNIPIYRYSHNPDCKMSIMNCVLIKKCIKMAKQIILWGPLNGHSKWLQLEDWQITIVAADLNFNAMTFNIRKCSAILCKWAHINGSSSTTKYYIWKPPIFIGKIKQCKCLTIYNNTSSLLLPYIALRKREQR